MSLIYLNKINKMNSLSTYLKSPQRGKYRKELHLNKLLIFYSKTSINL